MRPSVSPSPSPSSLGPHTLMFHVFGDRTFQTDGDLLALAFGPEGDLWSVEEPGILRQWQARERRLLDWHLLSETETLWAFSANARCLASGSDDLTLWNVARGRLECVLPMPAWVTALTFSPDNALLASGHEDGGVCLWDVRERRLLRELHGHERPVSAVAFSADGRRLASAGEDKLIQLWNLDSGDLATTLFGHTDRIPDLAWHPEGHRLYSAGWDTTARVWDTTTGEPIILLNSHEAQVTALALEPAGRWLACADSTSAIHVWDLAAHRTLHVLRQHTAEVRCLAFSSDGQLASGGGDRIVQLWSGLDGPATQPQAAGIRPCITRRVYHSSGVETAFGPVNEVRCNLALSPDGARLASIDGTAGLRLWDTAAVRTLREDRETGPLFALAWSADGRWLAGGGDGVVRLWEAASGERRDLLDGQPLPTTALAFTPDGTLLATAAAGGVDVWLWNPTSGEPTLLIPEAVDGCSIESLAFHPDGRLLAIGGIDWLATSGADGLVMLWDVVSRCPVAGWKGGVRCLAFHPSGRQLAVATLGRTVRVCDPTDERRLYDLTGHDDLVSALAYSPDGRWLASGGADRTVRLWEAETGRPLARTELETQIKAMAFSPDGRYLFTGNANTRCYQLDVRRLLEEGS